jgi:hypothetical protein
MTLKNDIERGLWLIKEPEIDVNKQMRRRAIVFRGFLFDCFRDRRRRLFLVFDRIELLEAFGHASSFALCSFLVLCPPSLSGTVGLDKLEWQYLSVALELEVRESVAV